VRYVDVGGVRISAIGLGTWQFGAREWGYGDEYAESVAPAIVARALELGINLIDTAEMYGFGRSERIVGRAIKGHARDDVFLATKMFPVVPIPPVVEWRAIESAARLGVDHLDLYQVHWPNPLFPIGTPMRAMAKLQAIGLVRNVGVSNFSLAQWQKADGALGVRVLSNQVQFSLAMRRHGDELLTWAAENDRVVIAYSPLAQGLLSGRYDKDNLPSNNVRRGSPLFLPENLDRATQLLGALGEVAAAHDATSAQVALAWLIRRPNVVVIPGASSLAQVEANAAAAELELSNDEDRQLSEESERFSPRVGRAAAGRMLQRVIRVQRPSS
jgi:aryl-alcohol dehydrogenase-like predicted oxidoreductase